MTVLVGHLMCTLDEPCTAHVTHNSNKKSGFLLKCIIKVDSAVPCLLHVTPYQVLDLSPCLMAPPTSGLSRILVWLSSALGSVGEKLCGVLSFPGSSASSLSQHIPAPEEFAMEPVPPFVPAERLFYAGGRLRTAFRKNLNFL